MTTQIEKPLLPFRLNRGETIGLFCPAGPVRNEAAMQAGMDLIHSQGFKVKTHGRLSSGHSYLADTDAQRVGSLKALWFDEDVRAILAIRGGFGCLRLLKQLDMAELRRQPKLFAGFSDITVLLNSLVQQSGLVAIHGPMLCSLTTGDMRNAESLFALLTGAYPYQIKKHEVEILCGGIGRGRLFGVVPYLAIIAIIILAVIYYLLRYTTFGRQVYMVGGNENASYLSGINSKRVKFIAFLISGLTASIAGYLLSCQVGAALPQAGSGTEMETITAVILGGVSLAGGKGKISGTILGVLILQVIKNGLTLLSINEYYQMVVTGSVLILAVMIDVIRSGILKK